MPHKVGFRVVAVSGEDDHHRAKELNVHGPTVQGWQSPRFCTYPQEIIVEFESRVRICKVQILSHQYLIASQIKISVGDLPEGVMPSVQNVKYKQLGYVSLSDNERTNFKARELKSIHVDVAGTYVRFVVYKNHVNRLNVCNQVGIVALNVIGEDVGKNVDGAAIKSTVTGFNRIPVPGMVHRRPDEISPLDDLTFDMYQDPEVAEIIRKLDAKKQEAVQNEKYDFAKKLKGALMDLYKTGETLGKYEVEKRQAIDMEDYDKARRKKAQMENFRMKIYEQLELPELLGFFERAKREGDWHTTFRTLHCTDANLNKHKCLNWHKNQSLSEKHNSSEGDVGQPRSSRNASVMRSENRLGNGDSLSAYRSSSERDSRVDYVTATRNTNAMPDFGSSKPIINSYVAHEERVVPSLRNKFHSASDSDELKAEADWPVRALQNNMTEQEKRQASLASEVFGLHLVQLAYSKLFSDREEALGDVREQILGFDAKDQNQVNPIKVFKAATILVHKGLKDIVLSVFTKSLHLLTALLQKFPAKHRIPKSELAQTVDKVLPELINKLGDKAQRLRTAAHLYILEMVDFPDVKALMSVPNQCCQPITSQVQPRLAQGQAELVEQLVNKMGIDKNSGLTLSTVMGFAVPALQHPNGQVRETAERIIITVYRENGREVRGHLPPFDPTTRKNTIFRHMIDTFDRIDAEAQQKRRPSVIASFSTAEEVARRRRSSLANLSTPELRERLQKCCIFCNEKNDSFTTEGLDLHYWKHCPMLMKCPDCKQVVEISGFTEHLLTECDVKDDYAKCKKCQEAIPKKEFDMHVKLRTCSSAKSDKDYSRCPLCHKNIPSGDRGWRAHLMGPNGCDNNSRRKPPNKLAPQEGQMKKSQSADRVLTTNKANNSNFQPPRMSRSTTRTFY